MEAFTEAIPSRHVNGDKLHHYSRQLTAAPVESLTQPPEETYVSSGQSTVANAGPPGARYLVYADQVTYQPAYEPSINPFLSHIEQGWKLKPLRHRNQKKKLDKELRLQNKHRKEKSVSGNYFQHRGSSNLIEDDGSQLPVDPNKPHFVDSNEAWDTFGEESRAFGDEEKALREYFNVLFSNDYNA